MLKTKSTALFSNNRKLVYIDRISQMSVNSRQYRSCAPSSSKKSIKSRRLYPELPSNLGESNGCPFEVSEQSFYTEESSSSSIEPDHESESDHGDLDTSEQPSFSSSKIRCSRAAFPRRKERSRGRNDNNGSIHKYHFLPIAFIVFVAFLCYCVHYWDSPSPDISLLKRYRQKMGSLMREKYPQEKSNTKNILRLIGEKWVAKEPREPYVVLITGSKAGKFASDVTSVLTEVVKHGEVGIISCHALKERHQLDREIANSLSKKKTTVILNDIDRLRGDAPLSLHSLCDPLHSPYPSALIMLTVTRHNLGSYPECEQTLSKLLLEEWQTGFLNEDRISPILSRITSYVICLES